MLNLQTKEVKTIHIADNRITDIKFSDDGKKMLFAREKDLIGIYDIQESKLDTFKLKSPFTNLGWIEHLSENMIINVTNGGMAILNTDNRQNQLITSLRGGELKLLKDNKSLFYIHYRWAGIVTGLDKIVSGVQIEETQSIIYPNPATNTINLNIDSKYFGGAWQLTDLMGKVLLKGEIENNENFHLDISNLPAQTYFLRISNGKEFKVEKVMKW
jgi:WD40 repeat protein